MPCGGGAVQRHPTACSPRTTATATRVGQSLGATVAVPTSAAVAGGLGRELAWTDWLGPGDEWDREKTHVSDSKAMSTVRSVLSGLGMSWVERKPPWGGLGCVVQVVSLVRSVGN